METYQQALTPSELEAYRLSLDGARYLFGMEADYPRTLPIPDEWRVEFLKAHPMMTVDIPKGALDLRPGALSIVKR